MDVRITITDQGAGNLDVSIEPSEDLSAESLVNLVGGLAVDKIKSAAVDQRLSYDEALIGSATIALTQSDPEGELSIHGEFEPPASEREGRFSPAQALAASVIGEIQQELGGSIG